LPPHQAVGGHPGIVLVEGGCAGGWHPVPGHWAGDQWMPTRCAPNDRGGDWSSPYPSYPAYPAYRAYPVYPYPAEPYWDWGWRPY
jgi:hypothetical protein